MARFSFHILLSQQPKNNKLSIARNKQTRRQILKKPLPLFLSPLVHHNLARPVHFSPLWNDPLKGINLFDAPLPHRGGSLFGRAVIPERMVITEIMGTTRGPRRIAQKAIMTERTILESVSASNATADGVLGMWWRCEAQTGLVCFSSVINTVVH